MYQTGCRHFSGYRPCTKNANCNSQCPSLDIPLTYILFVHLGPIHSVLRATALFPLVKQKYPKSHITVVTDFPLVLDNNPYVDRLLSSHEDDLIFLNPLEFDIGLILDKNILASSVIERAKKVDFLYGFISNENGAIVPANPSAFELWDLSLNSDLKNETINLKSLMHLQAKSLNLEFTENYSFTPSLVLRDVENQVSELRKMIWSQRGLKKIIGLYTSKIELYELKEILLSLKSYHQISNFSVVLIGTGEDEINHQILSQEFDLLQLSPLGEGLRSVMSTINACDYIIGVDYLGLQIAIACKKNVICLFKNNFNYEFNFYKKILLYSEKNYNSQVWDNYFNTDPKNDSSELESLTQSKYDINCESNQNEVENDWFESINDLIM